MTKLNLNEIIDTVHLPSMDYLIKKEFSEFRNLQKTILLKEIEFRNYNKWESEFHLQSIYVEKELGELYMQLMQTFKKLSITINEKSVSE
jgi:hypothetical protein